MQNEKGFHHFREKKLQAQELDPNKTLREILYYFEHTKKKSKAISSLKTSLILLLVNSHYCFKQLDSL